MPLPIGLTSQIDRIDVANPERRLICEVIKSAAVDLKRGYGDARVFFESHESPFWDYCAHLGLDGRAIRSEVLYGGD